MNWVEHCQETDNIVWEKSMEARFIIARDIIHSLSFINDPPHKRYVTYTGIVSCFYRRPTKLREGNVFTGTPSEIAPSGYLHPPTPQHQTLTCSNLFSWGPTPWHWHLVVVIETGGTHPTGMLSCFVVFFALPNFSASIRFSGKNGEIIGWHPLSEIFWIRHCFV